MTVDQYLAAVRALGLRPSPVPTIYVGSDGEHWNVLNPFNLTPDQRAEVIALLKFKMGVGPNPF